MGRTGLRLTFLLWLRRDVVDPQCDRSGMARRQPLPLRRAGHALAGLQSVHYAIGFSALGLQARSRANRGPVPFSPDPAMRCRIAAAAACSQPGDSV
jgi:hypothetical protein